MQRSLRRVVGSRRGWARQMGLAEGTVLEWRNGLTIPSLWCLLLVSSRVGISPLRLVCDQVGDVGRTAEGKAAPEARPDRPPQGRTTIDPEAVREALEAILASDEMPPPSLREIADRIGQTYTTLRNHVPELSRVIAARYRSYQEAPGTRTRAHLRDQVRQAAVYLHQQGHYPSSNRIAALISSPNSIRSPVAQSARYEVLRERLADVTRKPPLGGWALEAAESVCTGGDLQWQDVLDLLGHLVDKSLVVAEPAASGSRRYRLLESLRQYARDRLEASGEAVDLERRHAAYFVKLGTPARDRLASPDHMRWLELLDAERDNLRTALRWSLESDDPTPGLELVWGLGPYWEIRGHTAEGYRITRALVDAPSSTAGDPGARARALAMAAQLLSWWSGPSAPRRALAAEGLAIARTTGDPVAVGENLCQLAGCAMFDGHAGAAERLLAEALESAHSVGATNFEAMFALEMARALLLQRRHADAQRWLAPALEQCRELGHTWGVSEALLRLGRLAIERGDASAAHGSLVEALQLRCQLADVGHVPIVFAALAELAALEGDSVRTLQLYGAADALHAVGWRHAGPLALPLLRGHGRIRTHDARARRAGRGRRRCGGGVCSGGDAGRGRREPAGAPVCGGCAGYR